MRAIDAYVEKLMWCQCRDWRLVLVMMYGYANVCKNLRIYECLFTTVIASVLNSSLPSCLVLVDW